VFTLPQDIATIVNDFIPLDADLTPFENPHWARSVCTIFLLRMAHRLGNELPLLCHVHFRGFDYVFTKRRQYDPIILSETLQVEIFRSEDKLIAREILPEMNEEMGSLFGEAWPYGEHQV